MNLKKALLLFGAALVSLSFAASSAQSQLIQIGVGVPAYRPLPYYGPYACPYRYRAYVPVVVATPRVYAALPPLFFSRPAPVLQTQYFTAPSMAQPRMSASPIPDTPPTLIPPPSPQPTTPPTTPTMMATSPLAPPSLITPPLAMPTPQPIPAPPDEAAGTAL